MKDYKYSLSIIVPMYNAEHYIIRCLDSILQSIDIDNYEIILVDDGSIDNSVEIAQGFIKEKNASYIKIIKQDNSRQGAARNNGMSASLGKYIMFVDVDDYINSIEFSKSYYLAEQNNLDLFCFAFKIFDVSGNYSTNHQQQFDENCIYSGSEAILKDYNIGSACGCLYKSELLKRTGLRFREDMAHEDCEFMLRLLPKVERMMISSSLLYSYCWNDNSTDRNKSGANRIRLKQGDILVAESYLETANILSRNNPVRKYYYRKSNSLVTSFLMTLIKNADGLPLNEKLELLKFAKSKRVYPMRYLRTLSWKTTLIMYFLNSPFIEKSLIKFFSKTHH